MQNPLFLYNLKENGLFFKNMFLGVYFLNNICYNNVE